MLVVGKQAKGFVLIIPQERNIEEDTRERSNWVNNMESKETFPNKSGRREELNHHGPYCSSRGDRAEPEIQHGSPWRTPKRRSE
jgi:hypothetical protein